MSSGYSTYFETITLLIPLFLPLYSYKSIHFIGKNCHSEDVKINLAGISFEFEFWDFGFSCLQVRTAFSIGLVIVYFHDVSPDVSNFKS